MKSRSTSAKVLALLLSLLTLIVTAPFSLGETFAASPLGAVVTPGTVTVGHSNAPTGTTIFAGDRVATTSVPALINFISGSRIEMTKAAATFSRQGKTLVVQATQGLLRFNFKNGEDVQINAGKFKFNSVGQDSAHVGELGLNQNGQVVLAVTEGVFAALNTVTGERTEVLPNSPLVVTDQAGKGAVTKGGKTLTDSSKTFQANELKGKCVVANGEAYQVTGNTATVITVKGSFKSTSGSYDYQVVDCTKDALVAAGASAAAAGAAATGAAAAGAAAAGAAAGAGTAAGVSAVTVAAVVAGAAAAVGIGVGVYESQKSPSSR